MNRAVLLCAIPLALCGCSFQSDVKSTSTAPPEKMSVAAPTEAAVKPTPIQPTHTAVQTPAAPAAAAGYFEMKQDGKMYVFNDVPTMQKVAAGQVPANMVVMEHAGPNGETVTLQSGEPGMEKRLLEAYAKVHPKKEPG